jgi:hypothetical protein
MPLNTRAVQICTTQFIAAILLAASLGAANAEGCGSISSCEKKDVIASSKKQGCGLLMVNSRYGECVRLNNIKDDNCGNIACGRGQDNAKIKANLKTCLDARVKEQGIFKAGQDDVDKALGTSGFAGMKNKTKSDEVWSALMKIKDEIEMGKEGHAQQVQGVKNTLAKCEGW